MEPDLVGCDKGTSTLHIGEITTSGYLGGRGKDFHIGAVRKVFEAFSKFYLFDLNQDKLLGRISEYYPELRLKNLSCHFIIPEGSRFIKALGYRERLFKVGVMVLDEVPLPEEISGIMVEVFKSSQQENK